MRLPDYKKLNVKDGIGIAGMLGATLIAGVTWLSPGATSVNF